MKITREEARRIADLAHLEFDDASLDRLAGEMTKILEYVESLPLTRPSATLSPLPRGEGADGDTPLRDDEVRPSIDRDVIAQNAPAFSDGFFVVPRFIS